MKFRSAWKAAAAALALSRPIVAHAGEAEDVKAINDGRDHNSLEVRRSSDQSLRSHFTGRRGGVQGDFRVLNTVPSARNGGSGATQSRRATGAGKESGGRGARRESRASGPRAR